MKWNELLRRSFSRLPSRMVLTGLLFAGPALTVPALFVPDAVAQAQSYRTVDGKVLDKGDAPVKGAVVYLKDDHTLAIKSYIAGDDGGYHFGQLSPSADYTLWAESNGKKSSNKSISSFDSRNKFDYTLTVK